MNETRHQAGRVTRYMPPADCHHEHELFTSGGEGAENCWSQHRKRACLPVSIATAAVVGKWTVHGVAVVVVVVVVGGMGTKTSLITVAAVAE